MQASHEPHSETISKLVSACRLSKSLTLNYACLHQIANVQSLPWLVPSPLASTSVSCLDGVCLLSLEKQTFLLTVNPGLKAALPPHKHLLLTELLINHFKLALVPRALARPRCLILTQALCQHRLPRDSAGSAKTLDERNLSFKPPLATS